MYKNILILILTLFLVSCSSFNCQNNITSYSVVSHDNNTDLKILIAYDKILCSSPIPVYIMPMDAFVNDFLVPYSLSVQNMYWKIDSFSTLYGLFVPLHHVSGWSSQFIYINSSLTSHQIMSTYFHELRHYKCFKSHCACLYSENWVMEFHAFKNEIYQCIKNDFPDALLASLQEIVLFADSPASLSKNPSHKVASLKIYSSTYWQDAIVYLNSRGITSIPHRASE
jgi:hypothetical protein